MKANQKRFLGAFSITLFLLTFGSFIQAEGATSQSKQISNLQKQMNKMQARIDELQAQLDTSESDYYVLQNRVSVVETGVSAVSKLASYSESAITFLHVNERLGRTYCPSGSFSDFIGLGSVQIPYRDYADSAGVYRNSYDVIKCTITVLTKKP